MSGGREDGERRRGGSLWWALGVVALAWVGVVAARATAPSDLMDNDQALMAAYTTDIVANGRWIAQRNERGTPATKPPLYQWIAAGISHAAGGRATEATIRAPAAAATLGCAVVAAVAARRWFGAAAGVIAGVGVVASSAGIKMSWLARTDALYSLFVFAGAVLALRAWRLGTARAWVAAWGAVALAAMTKTPYALPLVFAGMLAAAWERLDSRRRGPVPTAASARGPLIAAHALGAALALGLVGGWFLLARRAMGEAIAETLLSQELGRHAVGGLEGEFLGKGFLRTPWYFVSRLLPWSAPAMVAMWRIVARPSEDADTRMRERFLFCFVLGGLAFVCLAARPRAEHVLPLAPAVAILAGREVSLWLGGRWRRAVLLGGMAGLIATAGAAWHQHVGRRADFKVRQAEGMRALASRLRASGIDGPRIVHVDSPYALQFYLGTMRVNVTPDEALAQLRHGAASAAAVSDVALLADTEGGSRPLREIDRWEWNGLGATVVVGAPGVGAN